MRYRKKPVVIEAVQVTLDDMARPQWLTEAIESGRVYWQGGDDPYYTIETLEGRMRANLLDYIIRGVKGELYLCKPDIFAATYEPAA
jgi:hypothetical protein